MAGSTWRRRPVALFSGVGVLAVAAVVTAMLYYGGSPEKKREVVKPPVAALPVALKPEVSSFDPANGTGFKRVGKTWSTATYYTAEFGNLKPGLGLVLDLGAPRDLKSVSFNARTGPLTIDLRSADKKPSDLSDWKKTGESAPASGNTDLDASGAGQHRYWMIWVSHLGPGNKAVISKVSATAKS